MNAKDTGNGQYVYDITLKETAVPSALKHLRRGRTASSNDSITDSAENNNRKKYAIALKETTAQYALKHLPLGRTASSIDSINDYAENNNRKISENENVVKKSLSYEEAVDVDLHQFIQTAVEGKLPKKAYYKIRDRIDGRLERDIEKLVGFSVEGYGNEISSTSIEHIIKRHGQNGKADHSMENFEDIAQIEYVINNYDDIMLGEESGEYKNSDGENAKTVILQKSVGENYYYVVEAVPDAAHKTLHVVSAYINKNGTFPVVGHAGINPPSPYVQNELQSNVPVDSITDSGENIKYSLKEMEKIKSESEKLSEQFDKWDGQNPRTKFIMGTLRGKLREVLLKADFDSQKIYMDASKIIQTLLKHKEMMADVIQHIPNVLNNPVIVMESKNYASRITLFGNLMERTVRRNLLTKAEYFM